MQYSIMEWTQVGTMMVVCIRPERVPNAIWERYIADLGSKPITKLLGVAGSSADVTSLQRKQMFEIVKRRGLQCGVVTDDAIVRGIVTAASWVGVDVKAFSWANLRDALTHLGLPQGMLERGEQEVMRLRQRCSKPGDPL